jgi:hypothetical protein
MDLCELKNISWGHLVWGYLYANIFGSLLICLVMGQMRKLVGHEPPKHFRWQPHVTGIIERTIYMMALLVGKPEFIVAWLVFKVAGGLRVWGRGGDDKDDSHKGRAIFSNMFNGSALSIFYAFVGYLIAVWWNERAGVIGGILILLTLLLSFVLYLVKKKQRS